MNRCCITLLTDFGLQDSYVGQMKGVVAGINPDAIVVDLSHAIPAQQIHLAALTLVDAMDAFPAGTIHVAVVDPGVGSSRRAIAAEIGSHRFVCPDNGLLTLVLQRKTLTRFVELDQPRWWRPAVSSTFHGRDVFAPVAAAWSKGCDLAELGSSSTRPLVELEIPQPVAAHDFGSGSEELRGIVLALDHFGNLITNLTRSSIPLAASRIEVLIGRQCLTRIVHCYADESDGCLVALFGGSERLEIAMVNGNAARQMQVGIGEPVTVRWKDPSP